MVRSGWLVVVFLVVSLAVASVAAAKDDLRATFTKPVPLAKSAGQHVRISWTLRDSAGHLTSIRRVFVKIVCPTGDSSTTTLAKPDGRGLYRANAIVPAGGIGTVTIGAKGATIRITNPVHG